MYPILHRYGPFFLYSYTVVLILAVLLAVALVWWREGKRPYDHPALQSAWFDAVLIMLATGLIGGRIGFVIGAWDYFQIHPEEAWQLWRGGLSYHGALLGSLGALVVYTVVSNQRSVVSKYLGLFAPGFALLVTLGWAGCWLDGCAYGQETTLSWLAADLPDSFGVYAIRYQTQVGGMLTGLLALLLPWLLGRLWGVWQRPLRQFGLTLLVVSLGHLLVGLGRGEALPLLWGWSVGLWLDGLLALAGSVAMFFGSLEIQRIEEA